MASMIDELKSFFNSSTTKKKISWFYENHGSGFEKWIQFELMHWLSTKKYHDVGLEHSVNVDSRMSDKNKSQIDLVVRMKGKSKEVLHAIELKVTKHESAAVRRAINDLVKLDKSIGRDWEFRSVSAVAICSDGEGKKYSEFLQKVTSKTKATWVCEKFELANSNLVIYIFGWRDAPAKAQKPEYQKFVQHLRQTAKELQITGIK